MPGVQAISMHYNTVYAVEAGQGLVLIDTGPDYLGAWEELRAALGPRLPDVVVATHGHNDHASLGAAWQQAGVPVVLGAADAATVSLPGLHQPGELEALQGFARGCGAPDAVAAEMVHALQRRHGANARAVLDGGHTPTGSRWPTGLRFVPYVADRSELDARLPDGLEIVPCPGHTPGNLVVVERAEGWLFSGDQLLPEMTATPGIQFCANQMAGGDWRFRSLPAFLHSLRRLAGEGFRRCYPGHGPEFANVEETVQRNIATIEARTHKVSRVLNRDTPASPWDICERLYRLAARRRPWQLLATVQGHLDILEERGLATAGEGGWLAT